MTLGLLMGASAAGFAFGQGNSLAIDGRSDRGGAAGLVDWVADPNHAELGSNCLGDGRVVECNEPGVTARRGATGRWYGTRIVDGLAGRDDIFASTSKFDDPGSWRITTGKLASKYDASEVYLANTADYLYIAVLRLGNNGATAFDLEFNWLPADPETPHVPNRSVGDVLMVLELGGSGTVEIDGYRWDGIRWVAFAIPPNTDRHINGAALAGPPWGVRDANRRWGAHDLARSTFAEVGLPIGADGVELPISVSDRGRSTWVGVRTRASRGGNGAMKDAFEYVRYEFSGATDRRG